MERAGSPHDPTGALCPLRGPGPGPCAWPCASSLPVSAPQHLISPHRPHLELLKQILALSPVAAPSAATCLGSLALSVWLVCLGLSSSATPGSPSLPLSCSLSLSSSFRAPRSWLPWYHCSGYQVVVGGREPTLPQSPPFPMPGTREAPWLGLIGGALGASTGLAGFSLAMGGGESGGMGMGVRI